MSKIAKALYEHDEVFAEVANVLFGDGADELISKFNPTGPDLSTPAKRKKDHNKRKLTAGLSAVGAGAGALGLAAGANEVRTKGWKSSSKLGRALIPAEIAGLGGEIMATKILHGDTKKKKPVSKGIFRTLKNLEHTSENLKAASMHAPQAARDARATAANAKKVSGRAGVLTGVGGAAVGAGIAGGGYAAGRSSTKPKGKRIKKDDSPTSRKGNQLRAVGRAATVAEQQTRTLSPVAKQKLVKLKEKVQKDASIEFAGELSKLDSDKRQVFGWASVTKVDGQDVFDRQGDYIALEEIEKSAYHYVHNSRKGGDMHERAGEVPLHKSDMIESFVVTPEKLEKMGLDSDSMPHGWWVGYQVNDEDLWQMVKEGKRVGFSIHGKGVRTPVEA